ncbi:MAG: CsbD family protein [Pseudorhodoplanes sp.]|jgi:uncharacterized protein YjbJ (UPF0337 family)|nr:CsbD family protein [Pseudorhodoplanes sp.]
MRAIQLILTAIVGISLLSTPITAQTPQPTPAASAPAKEPLRTVAWNKIAGNWKRFKGSIKQRWGKLTKNEIAQAQGRREALNGFIQARYGIDREAADRQIDEWLKTVK